MIVFPCNACRASLCAEEGQAGQLVRCPTCSATLKVPTAHGVAAPVGAGVGGGSGPSSFASQSPTTRPFGGHLTGRTGGKRYGFNCGYCSSRLEATEAMAAQEGQCPTCGNQIT